MHNIPVLIRGLGLGDFFLRHARHRVSFSVFNIGIYAGVVIVLYQSKCVVGERMKK